MIYKRELMGVAAAAAAKGCEECGAYCSRAITLANAPGDVKDFLLVLVREYLQRTEELIAEVMHQIELSLLTICIAPCLLYGGIGRQKESCIQHVTLIGMQILE